MSEKDQSYTALVKQIVRAAPEPLAFAEIMQRVESVRPIETRSPQKTIRSAINQCYFIAGDGAGKYGWYPRLLNGSRVRVPLITSDLRQKRIVFSDEVRELLWPSFFAGQEMSDRRPIDLELPGDVKVRLPLDHFGQGEWGTTGLPAFWKWLKASKAASGDALIIEAVDAEKRCYQASLDRLADRDAAAVRGRTEEVFRAAREHWWRRRAYGVAIWSMARHLLLEGFYRHPTPPDPLERIFSRAYFQVIAAQTAIERPRVRAVKARSIYQLKITLLDARPPVWRRVLVTDGTTLGELHQVIQMSMGWTDSHLHQFIIDGAYYSDPEFELDEYLDQVGDEHRTRLGKVAPNQGARFIYDYDFGDSWHHEVIVEAVKPISGSDLYPRCIAGGRACPPEDCGGVWGYENFLAVIADPSDPEHESMIEWAGEGFDPELCDIEGINWQLEKLAKSGAR